jgi:hypothetical protein
LLAGARKIRKNPKTQGAAHLIVARHPSVGQERAVFV